MIKYVNILALQTDNGVEQDVFFTDKKPTQELVDEIAEKYACNVVISCVGKMSEYSKATQDKLTFINKEVKKNDESNV